MTPARLTARLRRGFWVLSVVLGISLGFNIAILIILLT